MKKFEVSIEGKDVVLRSSAGEIESVRLNGGASLKVIRDNKILLKIESPTIEKATDDNDSVQLKIAEWIIANDGCQSFKSGISCGGTSGLFNGTPCPLNPLRTENKPAPACDPDQRVGAAKDWLDKYHQRKAEAAEEQGQTDGPEPVESCGNCRHAEDIGSNARQIVMCERTGRRSPVSFTGCPYFEPRTGGKSAPERLSAVIKSGDEAAETHSKIAAACLSSAEKEEMQDEINSRMTLRRNVAFPLYVSASDVISAFIASVPPSKPSAFGPNLVDERIAQLEKENSDLQSTNAHLRKELVWQFEQLMLKIEWVVKRNDRFNEKNRQACDRINDLETQNAQLQKKLDAAEAAENDARFCWNKEHERTRQRIKELEEQLGGRNQWPSRPRGSFFL